MTKSNAERYYKIYKENMSEWYKNASVDRVYGKPSTKKRNIEREILSRCGEQNGVGYCILTHNSNFFTCAYKTFDEDGLTRLHIYTPSNWDVTYIIGGIIK